MEHAGTPATPQLEAVLNKFLSYVCKALSLPLSEPHKTSGAFSTAVTSTQMPNCATALQLWMPAQQQLYITADLQTHTHTPEHSDTVLLPYLPGHGDTSPTALVTQHEAGQCPHLHWQLGQAAVPAEHRPPSL